MNQKYYKAIGVMSGTSLDGVDLALCHFHVDNNDVWKFTIEKAETIPYPYRWQKLLKEAIHFTTDKVTHLDEDYTHYLGSIIQQFIERHRISEIDAVCSHGHTLFHQPERGYTFQLGNQASLAKILNQTVVCDFRVQDVAMGGQGAPLVPIGDELLFSEYDFCLNLGGFANGSFDSHGTRIAYDICPVNVVLNHLAEKFEQPYDEGGQLAATGNVNDSLLRKLNALPFFQKSPPKSLGMEWVHEYVFPLFAQSKYSDLDLLRTYTEHVASQLAIQFKKSKKVLITGGGVYNRFLIGKLETLSKSKLIIPDSDLIEFKEALVFALLGILRLRGDVNCLASVTGALENHSSGSIFTP